MGKLLSDRDEQTLSQIVSWWRRQRGRIGGPSVQPPRSKKGGGDGITFQAPSGGIPAASSFTPGSATVDVLVKDTDGEWKHSGTETVHSFANEAICTEGLRLGWAMSTSSGYVVISQLCGDDRTFAAADDL